VSRARREQGVAEWTSAGGDMLTRPTFTCCHCNGVTIVPLAARAEDCGGFCRLCMKPTCAACADKGCMPFERRLAAAEAGRQLFAALES
jgi:hypothetical protein